MSVEIVKAKLKPLLELLPNIMKRLRLSYKHYYYYMAPIKIFDRFFRFFTISYRHSVIWRSSVLLKKMFSLFCNKFPFWLFWFSKQSLKRGSISFCNIFKYQLHIFSVYRILILSQYLPESCLGIKAHF